jgi:hypothetical protein
MPSLPAMRLGHKRNQCVVLSPPPQNLALDQHLVSEWPGHRLLWHPPPRYQMPDRHLNLKPTNLP